MGRKIFVTGASGFVGRRLCAELAARNDVFGIGRSPEPALPSTVNYLPIDLEADELPISSMEGTDCVIHLAGQAHGKGGSERQQLDGFRLANVNASVRLAQCAIESGVRRYIFVSSIGVHGTSTGGSPFCETSPVAPGSPYTLSKLEAERELISLFEKANGIELTIIRPPLVYGGGGAPGNFRSLLKLAKTGLPLPFGMCSNRRSLVSLDNLVSFLQLCIDHPNAGNESFLVADDATVSTRDIVCALRDGMSVSRRLVPVPPLLMAGVLRLVGKTELFTQLYEDLEVDCRKAVNRLGWSPNRDTLGQLEHIGKRYADSLV